MRLRTACVIGLVACRGQGPLLDARADETKRGSGHALAVLELFTSEGCSSCPPADALLTEIVGGYRGSERRVFGLAFHVDYWDGLGWPDRFSSAANTARQRLYARSFGSSGLYTPQMIVDGKEQLTGSDARRAAESLVRALDASPALPVALRPRAAGRDAVVVDYDVPGAPEGSVLNIAIVERAASTTVRAGENGGRELHHTNVVRAFTAVSTRPSTGSVTFPLTPSDRGDAGELIGYVQQPPGHGQGMPILGATESPLPP